MSHRGFSEYLLKRCAFDMFRILLFQNIYSKGVIFTTYLLTFNCAVVEVEINPLISIQYSKPF